MTAEVAVVVGAASGIGAASAAACEVTRRCVSSAWTLTGVHADGSCHVELPVDVTDELSVEGAFDAALGEGESLNVMVCTVAEQSQRKCACECSRKLRPHPQFRDQIFVESDPKAGSSRDIGVSV